MHHHKTAPIYGPAKVAIDQVGKDFVTLLTRVKQQKGFGTGPDDPLFTTEMGVGISNTRLADILVTELNVAAGISFRGTSNRLRHSSVTIVSMSKFK